MTRRTVKVAIAGVGNCASSLVQGVTFYRDAAPDAAVPGLMHVELGGYHVRDLEFTAAFDVAATKVGRDLAEAIQAADAHHISQLPQRERRPNQRQRNRGQRRAERCQHQDRPTTHAVADGSHRTLQQGLRQHEAAVDQTQAEGRMQLPADEHRQRQRIDDGVPRLPEHRHVTPRFYGGAAHRSAIPVTRHLSKIIRVHRVFYQTKRWLCLRLVHPGVLEMP